MRNLSFERTTSIATQARCNNTEITEAITQSWHRRLLSIGALSEIARDELPLTGAMTQNNLGTALRTLGERENGTARLEQAVSAYREALKERTRERVALDWATTQNNLGIALTRLAERERGGETSVALNISLFKYSGRARGVTQG